MTSRAVAIEGVRRHYEWGSSTAIPELLGQPTDGRRLAEMWFGAHPEAPSPVPSQGMPLDQLLACDPEAALGPVVAGRFGGRLPFLLKIIAADKALSIQVHPTREQAALGFAMEESAGVPRSAPQRNYRDPNHKPELLFALTPFDAMCGFQPVTKSRALLTELALPELSFLEDALAQPDPMRAAFTAVLTHPEPWPAVEALARRAERATDGALLAARLAYHDHGRDIGVLLTVLLNVVHLSPGECVYLDAGTVHAYLRGTAVEVMANSDNVLRCGLTAKHVDVPELLRIAKFAELTEPRWTVDTARINVPVPDFHLTRRIVGGRTVICDEGPTIALCVEGEIGIDDVNLRPGRAAFIPARTSSAVVGDGVLFLVGTPLN